MPLPQASEKIIMGTEILDNVESVNTPKFVPVSQNDPFHPFRQFAAEIENFFRRSVALASKIFTLFSIILELPQDYFSKQHLYEAQSEDHLRYMVYHPRSADEDAKVLNTWLRAHTDFGSLTLLWSQNIAGLQPKTPTGGLEARAACRQWDHLQRRRYLGLLVRGILEEHNSSRTATPKRSGESRQTRVVLLRQAGQ